MREKTGARLAPRSLHSWTAHSAVRPNQGSPIMMGWTPPADSQSGRLSLSVSSGTGGMRPASMSFRYAKQALRADEQRVASMMCSYVQPVNPGAVPRRSRGRTEARVSVVMQREGHVCVWNLWRIFVRVEGSKLLHNFGNDFSKG
jgi:hypothetical protein